MPSVLFHELVGYQFAKKNKKYDTNNFYLGTMVPDAINAYGFASKEKRWHTHIRDGNLEQWKDNILNFYQTSYNQYENTYLMGYVIHILTDIFCDKIYQQKLYPELQKKGYDYHSAYSYYEKAIVKFENSNIHQKWWEEVQKKFQKGEKIPINGISQKMIQDWINYTIEKYQNRNYEREDYITIDFVNQVLEEISKNLPHENE